MSIYTIHVSGGAFEIPSTGTGEYGISLDQITGSYTHQAGDILRISYDNADNTVLDAQGNPIVQQDFYQAEIDSVEYGYIKLKASTVSGRRWDAASQSYITSGQLFIISDSPSGGADAIHPSLARVEIIRGGTSEVDVTWDNASWNSFQEFQIGRSYTPQVGDTFTLTTDQYSQGEGTYNAVIEEDPNNPGVTIERFDDPNNSYNSYAKIWTSGTGYAIGTDPYNYGSLGYQAQHPVQISRGGEVIWTVDYDFISYTHHDWTTMSLGDPGSGTVAPPPPNTGNSTMSNKLFTTLLGTYSQGQRMPEKIDVAGGDSITLGPVTITSSSITAAMFTGQIDNLDNHSTSGLIEGSNLYFTDSRARAALVSPVLQQAAGNSMGSFQYDPVAGLFTLEQPSDEWLRGRISLADPAGDITLSDNADDLASLGYDEATGVWTFASANAGDVRNLISAQADDGLTYASGTGELTLAQSIKTDATPTFAGMTINGNLQVTGTKIIANVQEVQVDDNIIHLNKGEADPEVAGVRIESTEPMDKAILWVKSAGKFELREMPEDDSADAPLGDLLPIEALHFYGPLTGNVTGQVNDISNHDTDALAEGSTNLYFTDARVHAAVSARKGVQSAVENGVEIFEASIKDVSTDRSAKLEIQKDNGLEIDFSVATANVADARGALSFANNQLAFTPVTKADIQGDIDAENVAQAGEVLFGGIDYENGMVKLTQVKQSEVRASLQKTILSPSLNGSLDYDQVTGEIKFAPVATSWVRSLFSSNEAEGLSYDSATGLFSLDLNADSVHKSLAGVPAGSLGDELIAELTEDDAGNFELKALKLSDLLGNMSVVQGGTIDFDPAASQDPSEAADSQPVASMVYDNASGATTFKAMDQFEIRQMFSAAGQSTDGQSGLSYNAATGVFTLDPLDPSEARAYIDHNATASLSAAPSANTDLLASVSYDQVTGEISSQAASVGEVRDLIDAQGSSSLMSISYDSASGVITLDPMTSAEMFAQFDAEVDAISASGDHQFGDIDFADGVITLTRVKGSEIKSVFQSGSNAIEYIENGDGLKAGIKLKLDQSSSILSQSTAAGLRVDLTANNDVQARVDDSTPLAHLTEADGVFELKSMSEADVKLMLSADGRAARYDENLGEISVALKPAPAGKVSILSQDTDGLKASLSHVADDDSVGFVQRGDDGASAVAAENAQRLAVLSVDEAEVKVAAMDIADLRKAFSVPTSSNSALSYDRDKGEFKLADAVQSELIVAQVFSDGGANGILSADVDQHLLVDHAGVPVKAEVDAWLTIGSAHEAILAGEDMAGKIEMAATGSVHTLKIDGQCGAGDWLYMSASAPGKVTTQRPEEYMPDDGDGYAVVVVGRARAASAGDTVECAMHVQFQYNC